MPWNNVPVLLHSIDGTVNSIEDKLDDPDTGLAEIKAEIRVIEGNVTSPIFGLAAIKAVIEELELGVDLTPVLTRLDDPLTGLEEIKREVRLIEEAVLALDLEIDLTLIITQLGVIKGMLADPATGLVEIKAEIASIEAKIDALVLEVDLAPVLIRLDNPTFGLVEIKAEIVGIETLVGILHSKIDALSSSLAADIVDIQTDLASLMAEPAVLMKTFSGTAISNGGLILEDYHFPEVRHVSLTLSITGMPDVAGESVYVVVHPFGTASSRLVKRILPGGQSFYTVELDAQVVCLYLKCYNSSAVTVQYAMTTTYPR